MRNYKVKIYGKDFWNLRLVLKIIFVLRIFVNYKEMGEIFWYMGIYLDGKENLYFLLYV